MNTHIAFSVVSRAPTVSQLKRKINIAGIKRKCMCQVFVLDKVLSRMIDGVELLGDGGKWDKKQ